MAVKTGTLQQWLGAGQRVSEVMEAAEGQALGSLEEVEELTGSEGLLGVEFGVLP